MKCLPIQKKMRRMFDDVIIKVRYKEKLEDVRFDLNLFAWMM